MLLILFISCEKSPKQNANQSQIWLQPSHKKIELYISNLSGTQGANLKPLLPGFKTNKKWSCKLALGEKGQQTHIISIEYQNSKNNIDTYIADINYPDGSSQTKFDYSGKQIQLWKDSDYRIGIRPIKNKK